MAAPQPGGALERLIVPRALLAGVIASFVACCALGRAVSRVNVYRDFTRFHPHISCLSLYYPTASQARAVARAGLTPERIAVVVGGSSILYGHGQGAENLWTRHLQALLGDRYRVFNFAQQGAPPADFGPVAAEALERDHKKVIFVTNIWPSTGGVTGEPDGALHQYFFWDAYYKGLLTRDPEREARLAELAREKKDDEAYAELKRRARLDAWLYNQDLWTAFTYRCASAVWCPLVAGSALRARRRYPDSDPVLPAGQYRAEQDEPVLRSLRAGLGHRYPLPPTPAPDADYSGTPLVQTFKLCVPPPFRRRTLVVLSHFNPFAVKLLPPETQANHAANYRESTWALEQAGFAAMELGRDFTGPDYIDLVHVGAVAAPRMAAEVAAKVRQMARELGYTE
jgi:hypothetical protein